MGWAGASRPRQGRASILAVTTPGPGDQPAGRVQLCGRLDPQAVGTAPPAPEPESEQQITEASSLSDRPRGGLAVAPGPESPQRCWASRARAVSYPALAQTQRSPGGADHTSSGSHCFRVPVDAAWVWPVPEPAGSRDFPVARPSPTQPGKPSSPHFTGVDAESSLAPHVPPPGGDVPAWEQGPLTPRSAEHTLALGDRRRKPIPGPSSSSLLQGNSGRGRTQTPQTVSRQWRHQELQVSSTQQPSRATASSPERPAPPTTPLGKVAPGSLLAASQPIPSPRQDRGPQRQLSPQSWKPRPASETLRADGHGAAE